jgi:hypothetical protein
MYDEAATIGGWTGKTPRPYWPWRASTTPGGGAIGSLPPLHKGRIDSSPYNGDP